MVQFHSPDPAASPARYAMLVCLLACLALTATPVQARPIEITEAELAPNPKHKRILDLVLRVLDNYHYKDVLVDDQLSAQTLESYLDILDGARMFFLLQDAVAFSRDYHYQLDNALLEFDLQPAYKIFKRFRQRQQERMQYALSLLEQEFDFTSEEEYVYDRRDAPWIASVATMDALWQKRVKNDLLNLILAGKSEEESRETLRNRYSSVRSSTFQLNSDDVFQHFINAFTTAIEPHTTYFSPRTSENFDINMRLSLEGIGAVLRSDNQAYTVIQQLIPGGPAARSGELQAQDRIVGVGQGDESILDVIGWRLENVVELIRGPRQTQVRLEILPKDHGPEGPSRIVLLTRDQIRLEQRAVRNFIIRLSNPGRILGVIDVPSFYVDFQALAKGDRDYRSTTRDVRRLISELLEQNVDGLIVDLRGNGGGSLKEALELTGLFIKAGPIVQTKNSRGKIEINRDPDPSIFYAGPLAILVDRFSASASEIVAGAIQDYHRGIILGEPTFGKGTIQSITDLNSFGQEKELKLGRLKTTVAQFFRVSGSSNQYKGVTPDIVFPTAVNPEEYGERAFDNALPWSSLRPLRYRKGVAATELFDEVRRKHQERVAQDPDWQKLLQRIDLIRKTREQVTISLNREKREQERKQHLALQDNPQAELEEGEEVSEADLPSGADVQIELAEADLALREAARVLNDLIVPGRRTAANLD